jgi:hypothetical protein
MEKLLSIDTKNEFIPYSSADRLKNLGFDEPCFAWYVTEKYGLEIGYVLKSHLINDAVVAPLYQQAFKWIFKKYNYFVCFVPCSENKYFHFEIRSRSSIVYDTLEENILCNDINEINLLALNKLLDLIGDLDKFIKQI